MIWMQEMLETALLLKPVCPEPLLKHWWVPIHPPTRSCLHFSPCCVIIAKVKDRHDSDTLPTHPPIESMSELKVRGVLTEPVH